MDSSLIITGNNGIVYDSEGTAWWAEEGIIRWESTDGQGGRQDVRTTLERLQGISQFNRNRNSGSGFKTRQEVNQTQTYIEKMVELCRKAREQGSPDNPDALKDRARRRKKSVAVPRSIEKNK